MAPYDLGHMPDSALKTSNGRKSSVKRLPDADKSTMESQESTRKRVRRNSLPDAGFPRPSQYERRIDETTSHLTDELLKYAETMAVTLASNVPSLWRDDVEQEIRLAGWKEYLTAGAHRDNEEVRRHIWTAGIAIARDSYRWISTEQERWESIEEREERPPAYRGVGTPDSADYGRAVVANVESVAIAEIVLADVPQRIIAVLESHLQLDTLTMDWEDECDRCHVQNCRKRWENWYYRHRPNSLALS